MTANTEVDKLVEQVNRAEELQQLYRSLGYRSFRDSTRQLATEHNPDAEERRELVESEHTTTFSLLQCRGKSGYTVVQDSVFERQPAISPEYESGIALVSPTFVLTAIFEAVLTPLTRECKRHVCTCDHIYAAISHGARSFRRFDRLVRCLLFRQSRSSFIVTDGPGCASSLLAIRLALFPSILDTSGLCRCEGEAARLAALWHWYRGGRFGT